MEDILFFVTSFSFITLITGGVLQTLFQRDIVIEKRMSQYFESSLAKISFELPQKQKNASKSPFRERIVKPIWNKLREQTIRQMPSHRSKEIERKLRDAGSPFNMRPVDFQITQFLLGLIYFLFILFFMAPGSGNLVKVLVISSLTALIVGGVVPHFYINLKKKQRIKEIEKEMPDFFDMVNLSIEAGLGVDAAISKVCKQQEGHLSIDFTRLIEEMRLGKSRRESFSNLRDRVPSELFQSIMNAMIQADHLGIGMSNVLKSLTRRIREHQREKAREKAMKVPVKMLFPMVFFIFPSLFIVLLGPAVIYFLNNF